MSASNLAKLTRNMSFRTKQLIGNCFFIVDTRNEGNPVTFTGSDTDLYIVNGFRVKRNNVNTSLECERLNQFSGGLNLKFSTDGTYREYIYVRQLVWGNVLQHSGKTYTFLVDCENSNASLEFDFYIQARFNANDLERVLVVDSSDASLPTGRNIQKVTVTVPDLFDGSGNPLYTLDEKNSLSVSFRVVVPSGVVATNEEVNIHGFQLVEDVDGTEIDYMLPQDVSEARDYASRFYYKSNFKSWNGLNSSVRKRVYSEPPQNMYSDVVGKFYDAVGNEGKISTYDSAGVRTDNVTPIQGNFLNNGLTVITDDASTGIGFVHEIDVEGSL